MSRGFVVWLTGLSGAGKSTLAGLLEAELRARGLRVETLDGDEVRENLSRGLGFSKEDRDTNVRRIGYVAQLLARNGVAVIAAAISPYAAVRDEVRAAIEQAEGNPRFIEVHVDCAIKELTRRDTKGLYAKAHRGEIANFSGVSDPYEAPSAPELRIDTEAQSAGASLDAVLGLLDREGLIDGSGVTRAN